MTVEIPEKQWTLVIGLDKKERKFTVSVNGVEISALPKLPRSAASQPDFCKSIEVEKYSELIRSVNYYQWLNFISMNSPANSMSQSPFKF